MQQPIPPGRRWFHFDRARRLIRRFPADVALFFLVYYLYVWLVVDPRLIWGYHQCSRGLLFTSDWPFLGEHLLRPGGAIEYLARLLYQFYRFGWAGALIMTAAAWAACLGTEALARSAVPSWRAMARYVPAAILLMAYGGYLPILGLILALLAGLWCFVLYERVAPEGAAKRLSVFLALSAAVVYVAGAPGLLFAVLVALYELLIAKRPWMLMAAVVCGAAGLWLVNWLLGVSASAAMFDPGRLAKLGIPAEQGLYALALLVFFPAVLAGRMAGDGFLTVFRKRPAPREGRRKTASSPSPAGHFVASEAKGAGSIFSLSGNWTWTALAMAATGAAAWFSTDAHLRALLEIDYYVQQAEDWDQALQVARRMPRGQFDLRSNRNVLRALVQTGRLGDELFCYPQVTGVPLFGNPDKNPDSSWWLQESRLSFDVGFINSAERSAYEALAGDGQLPAVLEQLAMVNIIKGRVDTARVFLRALRRNPSYRKRAENVLRQLDEDPHGEQDRRVRDARSLMPDKDLTFTVPHEECLLALLEKNRHNRRALDLLMAYWLLAGRPEKVAANLWRLPDCGYQHVPRHYQEAVLEQQRGSISFPVIAGRSSGSRASAVASSPVDPEVVRRADLLDEILRRSPNWETAFRDAVAAGLGDTYRFYQAFGLTGL